ncbi:MAG TPA: ECF-type sigma factor [Blastocatellia bacterium]|nr:ECF-type sigma factor [Blastocatellia bacterium]
MPHPHTTFSTLLREWRQGDQEAGENLIRLVYDHLHWLAQHYLRQEHHSPSLQPTDLVNETYMRLFGTSVIELEDKSHFFVIAARQMRRILIERARSNLTGRRLRSFDYASLSEAAPLCQQQDFDLIALDEALVRLEEIAPRASQVVELRYFVGLTETQAAEALGVSVTTLKRDWKFARLWLHDQLAADRQEFVSEQAC